MTAPTRPLRALVVDDEGPARRILTRMLTEFCDGVHVVGEAADIASARRRLEATRPDVVFLDIDLGEGTGFDLVPEVIAPEATAPEATVPARTPPSPQVVFVTAYAEYALQAFRVAAVDYLVKPIELPLLRESVRRVREALPVDAGGDAVCVAVQLPEGRRLIPHTHIRRIRADGSYSEVYLVDGEQVFVTRKLGVIAAELPPETHLRVHRSHLVHLGCVRAVCATHVTLDNGEEVPIRRGSAREILAAVEGVLSPGRVEPG